MCYADFLDWVMRPSKPLTTEGRKVLVFQEQLKFPCVRLRPGCPASGAACKWQKHRVTKSGQLPQNLVRLRAKKQACSNESMNHVQLTADMRRGAWPSRSSEFLTSRGSSIECSRFFLRNSSLSASEARSCGYGFSPWKADRRRAACALAVWFFLCCFPRTGRLIPAHV